MFVLDLSFHNKTNSIHLIPFPRSRFLRHNKQIIFRCPGSPCNPCEECRFLSFTVLTLIVPTPTYMSSLYLSLYLLLIIIHIPPLVVHKWTRLSEHNHRYGYLRKNHVLSYVPDNRSTGRKIEVETMFWTWCDLSHKNKKRTMCGFLLTPDVRGSGLVHTLSLLFRP